MTHETPAPADETPAPEAPHVPAWALVLTLGDVPTDADVADGSQVVVLDPSSSSVADVTAAISASGLGPADLRARALLVLAGEPQLRDAAVVLYSALCGFAGRRLDVRVGSQMLELSEFDRVLRNAADAGRPDEVVDVLQVGGPAREDLAHVDVSGGFTPQNLSMIRFARRLRLVPADDTALALTQLVAVTAVRSKSGTERFPYLCDGSEAVDAPETGPGVDLHAARRGGEELRRELRGDTRDAVADFVNPSPRSRALTQAADADLVTVLTALGSVSKMIEVPERDEEGAPTGNMVPAQAWHCLKPANHTNGDATPSARILVGRDEKPGFRCFRCLPERVDALRLVMWARNCSPDEAADWIGSHA